MTARCSKCGAEHDRMRVGGIPQSYCGECHAEYNRQARRRRRWGQAMNEENYSKASCDMIKCASDDEVEDGQPGSFFIEKCANGQRLFWHRLPNGSYGCLYLRPVVSGDGGEGALHSWNWDGNEDKPTLHPSVHLPGRWHGWFRKGRMESC